MRQVNLGILGGGTVGGGVYQAVKRNGALMASRLGIGLRVVQVAVRDLEKRRAVRVPRTVLTGDWREVVRNPDVDLVVELMGGTSAARVATLTAFKLGKSVVTANKALISAHGEELFAAAQTCGTNLYYEASVAGGIPIIKVLREGMIGNRIVRLYGILNGTCNYILTRMKKEGIEFETALADAQRLGYAEAEPSLDVDGLDAMHKTGILASLAHGFWVNPRQIFVEGIRGVTPMDITFAEKMGYTVKLLASVKKPAGKPPAKRGRPGFQPVQVTVCRTLVPDSHVLASVNGVYNAVFVEGDIVGGTLYYGQGAGQDATASAVLSDLADAALDLKHGTRSRIPPFVPHEEDGSVLPLDEVVSRYYLRLNVADRPGTLAKVAAILASAQIGISSVIQPEGHEGSSVPLILMTHRAAHAAMAGALAKVRRLAVVKGAPVLLRVETFE